MDQRKAILDELCKAAERLGDLEADRFLLAIIASWGDTLDDDRVLAALQRWNRGEPPFDYGFNRAAEILGGEEGLARFLYAEPNELRYWKRKQPPVEVLQLVAGLLMHQLLKKYDQSAIRTK
jgi:hypothetical protein